MPSPNKPGYDKILADCGPSKHNNCKSHLPNIHVFVYTVQPAGEEYLYESTPATFYDVKQQRQLPYLKNNSQSTINIHICFFTVKCFYWRKGNDAAELREFLFRPASEEMWTEKNSEGAGGGRVGVGCVPASLHLFFFPPSYFGPNFISLGTVPTMEQPGALEQANALL